MVVLLSFYDVDRFRSLFIQTRLFYLNSGEVKTEFLLQESMNRMKVCIALPDIIDADMRAEDIFT